MQKRPENVRRFVGLVCLMAMIAIGGCAVANHPQPAHQPKRSSGGSQLELAGSSVPAWAEKCLPPKAARLGPEPEYVGLTWLEGERLARASPDEVSLIYVGGGGRCGRLPSGAVAGPAPVNPVVILVDRFVWPEGNLTVKVLHSARILVAEKMDPRYWRRI